MPTRSRQIQNAEPELQNPDSEWTAQVRKPPRSVFGNYFPQAQAPATGPQGTKAAQHIFGPSLRAAIDTALARSVVYRFLAQSYEDPTPDGWDRMLNYRQPLESAIHTLAAGAPEFAQTAAAFAASLRRDDFAAFHACYLAAFGHAARGNCPLNEIEYADLKADPLFQPHRLADLAGFYRAFGLEVAEDADERHDHICLELEFMCVLAAKEAYALEHQLDLGDLSVCRDASRKFLREHLGRWAPAFARRLARMMGDTLLGALATLTRQFVESDCARYGIAPGSEELVLRSVDESAEAICHSCGLP